MKLRGIIGLSSAAILVAACGGRTDSEGETDNPRDFSPSLDGGSALDDDADDVDDTNGHADDVVNPPSNAAPVGSSGGRTPGSPSVSQPPVLGPAVIVTPGLGFPVSGEPLPKDLPWPEGCDTGYHEGFEGGCQSQLNCVQGTTAVYCNGFENESQCFCQNGFGSGTQVLVSGAPTQAACAVAAAECLKDAAPDVDEKCEVLGQSYSAQYCDLTRNCTRTPSVTGGVKTSASRQDGVNCGQEGDAWTCSCMGNGAQFSFTEPGRGGDVCGVAMGVCDEDALKDLGPAVCENDSVYAGRYDCNLSDQCLRAGVTQNGLDVQSLEWRFTNCVNEAAVYGGGTMFGPSAPPPGQAYPPGLLLPPTAPKPAGPGGMTMGDPNKWQCSCSGSTVLATEQFSLAGTKSLDVCQEATKVCARAYDSQ